MTTTENTYAETVDRTPDLGFKNPTNWVIGPLAGIAVAAVLAGGLKFVPTWAVYSIVALVSIWLVFQALDRWKDRPSSEDEAEPEDVRETADVA